AKDKKWLEYGTEEKNVLLLYTVLDFWQEDGLKLGWRDEEDGKDYFALMYRQSDKRCYLNEVANDILEETPSDTGKVGYICEYDS
ncbi:MAG: hypothetical protein K2M91_02625, partial [Lachnospiraceae bacterium]|nr:hypothetical protein [Lachnospiraceae bacterium]